MTERPKETWGSSSPYERPTYLASLDDVAREQIRERLQARLPAADGFIALTARAWAVQGTV